VNGFARFRRPTRPQAAALAAVVAVIAVIAGLSLGPTVFGPPSSSPGASGSPANPSPSTTEGPAWAQLALTPLARVASLEPTKPGPAGVAPDTAFTLRSLTGEAPTALAARLEVSPSVALTVATTSESTVVLSQAGLEQNRLYRFTLRAPDGSIAGSWAYRVQGPVSVLSTIPGNATNGVPLNSGIEVTFNQEGVADMADHFSISPAVTGRFERHGLTQVFVPDTLKAETLYTVTIRAGLARTDADLALPSDVVFGFETQGAVDLYRTLYFAREVIESSPAERPVMAVIAPTFEGVAQPKDTKVDVYRVASLDAAARTLADFLAQPHWAQYTSPLMPTEGLPVAATFTTALEPIRGEGVFVLRFPDTLAEGSYIVEIAGSRKAQAFLQVTPVSVWVSILTDRTVVWVNDVGTGRALPGATVAVGDDPPFASSDANGLAIGRTPAELIPPAALGEPAPISPAPLLRVTSPTGNTVLVPFGVSNAGGYRGEWSERTASANETYWAMLFTDRGLYRSNDKVDVWGYLRNRDDASVPASVEVRLVRQGEGSADTPSIVEATAAPGATGTFTASLALVDVPTGWYEVQAVVDGDVVVSRWLEVSIIRKPPYQLEVTPDHSAMLSGDTVRWTATATFFDGSAAASLPLTMTNYDDSSEHAVTTDAAGVASLSATVRRYAGSADLSSEDPSYWTVGAYPTGPESSEIWASDSTLVFPTAYHLTASGLVADGQLRVTGSLNLVDLAKVERQLAAGAWDGDAAGAGVGGKSLQVQVTELIPVKRLVANDYDFIEKVVRPRYEYDTQRRPFKTLAVTSGTDGRISFSLAVVNPAHEYEVVLSTRDDAGRFQRRTIQAGRAVELPWWLDAGPVFQMTDGSLAGETAYRIGSQVVWRIADGGRISPSGGDNRYLYLVAQRGLVSADVADSSTFRHRFAASDAPGVFVIGVRFTGTTYAPKAAAWANFDFAERSIKVTVTSDRERYRPGELVTLSVTTADEAGHPIAASVVMQGVDEKLYAIGGASTPSPLDNLYTRVDSGIVRLTATHQVPSQTGPEGEGGDATGGGPRSDFRDTLFFTELTTDSAGKATTTVRLSDDLTSWHVAASAVTASLQAGVGELLVPVGLPFFVEATTADEYLVSDRPVIQLRAFGEGLTDGDPVEFTVASTSLGLAPTTVSGTAFRPVPFELPALSLGTSSIDIAARTLTRTDPAGKPLTDRLLATFRVIESRLGEVRTAYGTLGGALPSLPVATGITTYTFSDAGRGRYLPLLIELAQPAGSRLDRALAQSIARRLLIDEFGRDPASLPSFEIDLSSYPVGQIDDATGNIVAGVALLPYGGVDPWLAVRVALDAPDGMDARNLAYTLRPIRDLKSAPRDLAIAAVAALAALGEPVMADLREIGALPDLTPMEQIYLALGYEALGDDATALEIERGLLGAYGERLGSWVRLRVGTGLEEIVDATSLLSVVAAGLGDPLAPAMADYVVANPGKDTIHALDLAAFMRGMIARTPAAAASFAYTVDGQRRVVNLDVGDSFVLELTAGQRAGLALERLSGTVGVAIEATVGVVVSGLRPSADLTLKRTVPASPIPTGRVVVVDLTATFSGAAPENGCYDVVELVPSGLAPLSIFSSYREAGGVTWPSSVIGQKVTFCATNTAREGHRAHLRYMARIVNEGTFTWEPAIMQLGGAPEAVAFVPPTSTVIGKP